ncbi:DUF6510 family protein [Micromonospora sp. NPDC049559]|uniref:DUF6510 family protein n=1 Tax=Micromonospora sp. NPDC049559 TaxID=3155923 RepID=UPI00342C42E7
MTDQLYTDGNVLAGPLREVFAVDVTTAVDRCASCGMTGPVASLRVYSHAPGLVARCPNCDAVVLRLVRGPNTAWLDLRGATFLQIPMPPEPVQPVLGELPRP